VEFTQPCIVQTPEEIASVVLAARNSIPELPLTVGYLQVRSRFVNGNEVSPQAHRGMLIKQLDAPISCARLRARLAPSVLLGLPPLEGTLLKQQDLLSTGRLKAGRPRLRGPAWALVLAALPSSRLARSACLFSVCLWQADKPARELAPPSRGADLHFQHPPKYV
jgi:hypothetical protein